MARLKKKIVQKRQQRRLSRSILTKWFDWQRAVATT